MPSAETIVSSIGTDAGTDTTGGVTTPPGPTTNVAGTRAPLATGAGALVTVGEEAGVPGTAGGEVVAGPLDVVGDTVGAELEAEGEAESEALELAWPEPPQAASRSVATSPRTPSRNLTLAA